MKGEAGPAPCGRVKPAPGAGIRQLSEIMKKQMLKSLSLIIFMVIACAGAYGQRAGESLACKQEVFARLQPLPKLSYRCRPDAANDYDEAILKWPERARAIKDYMRMLEALSERYWWETSVDDLNVCYVRGSAGKMDEEEAIKFRRGDYPINLFGQERIRLVLASDPCYQTGYGGSNAFLLYRRADGRVTVTQVLDGHFSRADNSVGLDFADLNAQQLVEVSTTTGGLNPYITNYYFVIDRATGRAMPKRLFRDGQRLTNRLTSVLILYDGTFPEAQAEMKIIKGKRLARRFYTYEDRGGRGSLRDASGRSLQRRVYIWNGQYYSIDRRARKS
jgi:hypothetical protein